MIENSITPRAVVIDDIDAGRELTSIALESSQIGFKVDSYDSYYSYETWQKSNPSEKVDLFLLDYKMPRIDGLKAAELISKIYPNTQKILTTDHKEVVEKIDLPNIDKLVYKHINFSEYQKGMYSVVSEMIRERKIVQHYNIGVIGVGKLGDRSIKFSQDLPYIDKIFIYSRHGNDEKREQFEDAMRNSQMHQTEKLVFCHSLESIIDKKPNILLGTSGKYGFNSSDFGSGKENMIPSYDTNFEFSQEIFYTLEKRGFEGMYVCETTPPELLIAYGRKIYRGGILTSWAADTIRARAHFIKDWQKRVTEEGYGEVRQDNIDISVIGTHRWSIPLLNKSCRIKGFKLEDVLPEFKDHNFAVKYADRLKRKMTKQADKSIEAGRELSAFHRDTSIAMRECLENIAYLKRCPNSSWVCEVSIDGIEGYILAPAIIDYRNCRLIKNFNPDELDESTREKIKKQLLWQNKIVRNRFEQMKLTKSN